MAPLARFGSAPNTDWEREFWATAGWAAHSKAPSKQVPNARAALTMNSPYAALEWASESSRLWPSG